MTAGCSFAVVFLAASLLVLPYDAIHAWSFAAHQQPWWHSAKPQRLRQSNGRSSQPVLDAQAVGAAVRFAELSASRLERLEHTLGGANVRVVPGSPAHGALLALRPTTPEALERHAQAQLALKASQYLAENNCRKFNLKEKRCGALVNSVSLAGTSLEASCRPAPPPNCQDRNPRYRSLDGTCNNPKHPTWGAALSAYRRLVPPNYADGLQSPRSGRSLPGPREASVALVTADTSNSGSQEPQSTLAIATWAQFVSMDLAHTPTALMVSTGSSIACCKPDGRPLPPRSRHPACLPVTVRRQDVGSSGRSCFDLVRSITAPRPDCRFGHAEQMNQATHWMDGSPLYGSSETISRGTREQQGGRLMLSNPDGLLPRSTADCQINMTSTEPCSPLADSRVNEQPLVTSLVTLLAREHNRIATRLNELNPRWSDETLFQEARRIVVAEIQYITYYQWLPHLVGTNEARQVRKAPYSADTDPSVINSFASLPFTLSMLPTSLEFRGESRDVNGSLPLRHHYNRPGRVVEPGRLDDVVRVLATQQSLPVDLLHTEEVTTGMYAANGRGLDAVSLAIQRGRDHGLPGYNAYRAACGKKAAKNFEDFSDVMDSSVISALRQVYRSPDDVDLYLGAVAERPNKHLGPTLICLITKQLKDTRRSDRYFYDVHQDAAFTSDQFSEIRKASLARLFCDNGDHISSMQPDVFRPPNIGENAVVPCTQIPAPNLAAWKEQETAR